MGQLILVESFFEAKDAIVEQPVPYSANSNETSATGSRIYSKFVHRPPVQHHCAENTCAVKLSLAYSKNVLHQHMLSQP